MILYFIKSVKDQNLHISQQVWIEFLEALFYKGLIKQLHSPSLRNYLMIQMAKTVSLHHFADLEKRKQLAYSALHGGQESRRILLQHLNHFELNDPKMIADIAFKGVLLGGAVDIDLYQFLTLKPHEMRQILFLIHQISPEKAQHELKKLHSHYPEMTEEIRFHLRAS